MQAPGGDPRPRQTRWGISRDCGRSVERNESSTPDDSRTELQKHKPRAPKCVTGYLSDEQTENFSRR